MRQKEHFLKEGKSFDRENLSTVVVVGGGGGRGGGGGGGGSLVSCFPEHNGELLDT